MRSAVLGHLHPTFDVIAFSTDCITRHKHIFSTSLPLYTIDYHTTLHLSLLAFAHYPLPLPFYRLWRFPDTGVEMLKPLRLHLSVHYLYQVFRCNIQVIILSRSALLTVCRVSRSCFPDLLSGIILFCTMFH